MAYPVQTDPTAVFGRRCLAVLIDSLLIFVPVVMLLTASFEYLETSDLPFADGQEFCDTYMDQRDGICVHVDDRVYFSDGNDPGSTLLWLGLTVVLLVILQGLTGWTPGKLLVGIRCVREDGQACGVFKALVRWVLWIVDGFPYFLPLVGFIVGLTTVGHRRVGDMAAKTFVVRRAAMGSPIVVPGLTAPPPPPATPARGAPRRPTRPARRPDGVRRSTRAPPDGPAPPRHRPPRRPLPTPASPSGTRRAAPTSSGTPRKARGCSGTRAPRPGPASRVSSRSTTSAVVLDRYAGEIDRRRWSAAVEDGDRAETALEVVLEGPRGEVLDLRGGLRRNLVEGLTEPTPEDVVEQHERVG